jgi:hypothetical protein
MTQFNPLAVNAFPERSNRRLECFNGTPSGEYAQRSNLAAWPLPQPGNVEQCGKFFDGDGSSGLALSRFSHPALLCPVSFAAPRGDQEARQRER